MTYVWKSDAKIMCLCNTTFKHIKGVVCYISSNHLLHTWTRAKKDKLSGNEAQYINFNNRACNDVPRILYSECGTQGTFLT